jgi:ligand-binding sensor domain-containing protein/AraC-like DNA-binding protein
MRTIFAVCVLIHIWLFLPLHSVKPDPSIGFFQYKGWTGDDGLPMNSVMAIAQTPDGYLWAGTEAGLARFDGIKFTVFSREHTPGFPGYVIVSMLTDRSGNLWIATRASGICRYRDGIFTSLKEAGNLINDESWCIMESTDNSIWIGSRAGLCRIANNQYSAVPLPEYLANRTVIKLIEDREGYIWVGTLTDGMFLIKKRSQTFEAEHVGPEGLEISALFEDRKGIIWVGTVENGLYRFRGKEYRRFNTSDGLTNNNIGCFYEDRFGNLWVGTHGGGINIVRERGDESIEIFAFSGQEEIKNPIIYSFYQDREETLWIGTGGGGIISLRESSISTYTKKHGLSDNNVYGAFEDSKGRIWTGTKGYGINYLEPGSNRFKTLTTKDGLSFGSVVSIAENVDGSLWFGTLGGGVSHLKNGKFESFTIPGGLPCNTLRAVYVDPEGHILVGGKNGGVFLFTGTDFRQVADVKFRVNTFMTDSSGRLWIGTFGSGICRVNLDSGEVETFGTQQGMSNNIVSSIHEDRCEKGVLWVGTTGGFNRFKDGSFRALSRKDGLPDDVVYGITEDHHRDFWISSNQGIYRLDREEVDAFFNGEIREVRPTVYGKESGMRSIECNGGNHPPCWRTRDGRLCFPTTEGICIIEPKSIGINKRPPPVAIERVVLNGKDYPLEEGKTIEVPPGNSVLEFHFTALSFVLPKSIRFKYKLSGFDEKWINAGSTRVASFTGLPPGDFEFRVAACNCDGIWNETGAGVRLHLKGTLLQRPVFKIFLFVMLALLFIVSIVSLKRKFFPFLSHLEMKSKVKPLLISPDESGKYTRKLLYLMEVEKLYKNPGLSIRVLATRLMTTPRILSQIIHDELETNFFDFVTGYRIKEARRILSDSKTKNEPILNIAYEIGYNSKSAFNRAFKNTTGMTPSEFKKKKGTGEYRTIGIEKLEKGTSRK